MGAALGIGTIAAVASPRASNADVRTEVERYPWYHTLELGAGVVTDAMFDHRPVLDRYPVPADLDGLRCLDVGTMDGFWAFEMERRGAASVTAIDLDDPEALDWPASLRAGDKTLDETKAERFALAKRALGSSVERVTMSAYDLNPGELGRFDFVFCGDLLIHLRDPVRAVERIRSVCGGSAGIVNNIKRFRFRERMPIAELDGVEQFVWWHTNLAGLVRVVRAGGFPHVEAAGTFELPFKRGGPWRGLRGAVRAYVDGK
jgi:2-polyprenyl-3-methyl-5-hydroxy-6-metoxy-1,4-benzoquinol methylase